MLLAQLRCDLVSSASAFPLGRRGVFLKKSASVVAKDSASSGYKSVYDGVVENRLGICGILAFLIVGKPRLFLLFACLSGSLHGLTSGISFHP